MKRWKPMFSALLLACVLALSAVLAGCGNQASKEPAASSAVSSASSSKGSEASSSSSSSAKPKASDSETLTIEVYYPNEQGTKLIASSRKITTSKDKDKYTAALASLMQGPTEKGQATIFPKKAKLLSVTLKGDTAVVNFSKELQTNFVGGSTGEEMLVGSIVNTLTDFPEVKNVHILIEGKNIETLSGHMDLSVPVERMKSLL